MSHDPDTKMTREERLAAKLRENLRRRKAQSRGQTGALAGESEDSRLSNRDMKS
ncbi:hypothetical protein [Pelagerythrobacter marensis]|uniref:Uncharacterized protein n=1 Tax=Pelagerythrobacter marensis TaxID=543877 RepID=A0A0G3XCV9_9SPHN|nr:hypothetical protein [Pelagerythrobacter marensis]AKM08203.1 hypothetical protein AM2010_2143 [Pelagerythrobacter marensis]